jgi:hypothetical protein
VVDGLGESQLKHLSLKTALHEPLGVELKNIIKSALLVGHETVSLEATDKRRGLEETLGVLRIQGQQSTRSL